MAESRVEDLLETGVEQPVVPMSEIEAILRGEPVTPHSRIAELLLKYNPSDILIEKRITENGTYTAQEGKAYTPVTVNVSGGSSDFSTAEVTVYDVSKGITF